jgi:hypothetical protein
MEAMIERGERVMQDHLNASCTRQSDLFEDAPAVLEDLRRNDRGQIQAVAI